MKEYRVKVTEEHIDYVWIEAESRSEALELAPNRSDCHFDCVSKSEIVDGVEFF